MEKGVTEEGTTAKPAVDLSVFRETVAARVGACNPLVLERVVDHYAEQEATRRVPLILKGLEEEEKARKALEKIKPEQTFDDAGEPVSTFWTRGGLDAKRKAEETLKRWQDALGAAITDSNYQPLEKLAKGGGDKPKPEAE